MACLNKTNPSKIEIIIKISPPGSSGLVFIHLVISVIKFNRLIFRRETYALLKISFVAIVLLPALIDSVQGHKK